MKSFETLQIERGGFDKLAWLKELRLNPGSKKRGFGKMNSDLFGNEVNPAAIVISGRPADGQVGNVKVDIATDCPGVISLFNQFTDAAFLNLPVKRLVTVLVLR